MKSGANSLKLGMMRSPSSLEEVYEAFVKSPEFGQLAIGTQENYRYLKRIVAKPLKLSNLNHQSIENILPSPQKSPGQYRKARSAVFRLCSFAIENGWVATVPLHRPSRTVIVPYKRWTREEVDQAVQRLYALGDYELQLAVRLMYETGQRLVDICQLTPDHREVINERPHFRIVQQKTGNVVYPEITPEIELAIPWDTKPGQRYIKGTPKLLRERWRRRSTAVGLEGRTLHGLRKAAICEAAEGEATMPEVQALGGFSSISTAALYCAQADKAKLASSGNAKRRR